MPKLARITPRLAALDTRLARADIPLNATADQRYAAQRRRDSTTIGLYGTRRWKALRARQLASEPLCRMCTAEGRVTAAIVCDHVEPHRGDVDRFWAGPFQSLCTPHHNAAKQREERRQV